MLPTGKLAARESAETPLQKLGRLFKRIGPLLYLRAYEAVRDAQQGLARYLHFYNQLRPHRALDGRTPDRVYWENRPTQPSAA